MTEFGDWGTDMSTYFSIYSLPAFAKYCGLGGPLSFPLNSYIIFALRPIGLGLSSQMLLMLPGFIFSNPTTNAQSIAPFLINVRARCNPVEPVAQALFVL
jgi:hypothetical protein